MMMMMVTTTTIRNIYKLCVEWCNVASTVSTIKNDVLYLLDNKHNSILTEMRQPYKGIHETELIIPWALKIPYAWLSE